MCEIGRWPNWVMWQSNPAVFQKSDCAALQNQQGLHHLFFMSKCNEHHRRTRWSSRTSLHCLCQWWSSHYAHRLSWRSLQTAFADNHRAIKMFNVQASSFKFLSHKHFRPSRTITNAEDESYLMSFMCNALLRPVSHLKLNASSMHLSTHSVSVSYQLTRCAVQCLFRETDCR